MSIISSKQLCQAFDPMMIIPGKTYNIINDYLIANTSCVAPAYVLLEGSRGKRYLCDFHYQYEKDITLKRTPHLWKDIEKNLIDEREKINKTFDQNTSSIETINNFCWCKKEAYVKTIHIEKKNVAFYCNFHFRKVYYRYYSNNVVFESIFKIIDERYRMSKSIVEESNELSII